MIKTFVRNEIIQMKPVAWGDIPEDSSGRLLWGENPLLPTFAFPAIQKETGRINRYPSPRQIELKKLLAKYNTIQPKNILLTNGSDEALELIAKVFISQDDEVIIPSPSYPCFTSVSEMMGAKIISIPLATDFSLSIEAILQSVTDKTKIIWLANPNNPTGNLLVSKKQIETIAQKANCILAIDECYAELGGTTGVQLINTYPNVVIVRSFSKVFALAGARLGYIAGNSKMLAYLNTLQKTNQVFSVNRFAVAVATAMLQQPRRTKAFIEKFSKLKKEFESKLKEIPKLCVLETKTTFCLVKILSSITARQVRIKLQKKNIFIKDCSIYEGLGKQYMYLGIPQKRDQKQIIACIKASLQQN